MTNVGPVHVPVLLDEVIRMLEASHGGVFLDCTFGGGGHTCAILDAHPDNIVVAVDRDMRALERARALPEKYKERLTLHHAPFSQIEEVAGAVRFTGVLADLGMSTDQLKEQRGFSFADRDALDMRMDESQGITAEEFLNTCSERDLYLALVEGGVGKTSKGLVKAIQRARPIQSAAHLAEIVRASHLGKRAETGMNAATVVFQALRMAVNREREEILALLESMPHVIAPSGRFACITFHSIEDRLVTHQMREWDAGGSYPASWRGERVDVKRGDLITQKPIVPTDDEVIRNPASRSARLRVFEFSDGVEKK